MTFDDASLPHIADELGCTFTPEPYAVHGQAVYAGTIATVDEAVRLVLWPSLGRVDVSVGRSTMVLKEIERIDLYPGIEVNFRRRGGGYLFVTRAGQVTMVV